MRHGGLRSGREERSAVTVGIEIADWRLVIADWPVIPITHTAGFRVSHGGMHQRRCEGMTELRR